MESLNKNYSEELELISSQIQASETLASYLDEEDEEMYKTLQDEFEPSIAELYEKVANENPLQLEQLEKKMLDPSFEGLFLPKILGYSVLRGFIDQNVKYAVPQNHFKEILTAICNSPNFEQIKKRIGQTTQIGFALSSDIWITNFIDSIENKKIKTFLSGLKSENLRDADKRKDAVAKYKNQFSYVNYFSADFPKNKIQLISSYPSLKTFLLYRAKHDVNNSSLMPYLGEFINNKELRGTNEFIDIMIIIGLFFPFDQNLQQQYTRAFDEAFASDKGVIDNFFQLYDIVLCDKSVEILPQHELALASLLKSIPSPELSAYYNTVSEVHSKGFVHPDAIEAVRSYYEAHQGLSQENECVRTIILGYISRFLNNLDVDSYSDYFEINKIITAYIGIFSNESFNQAVKESSMNYVSKCFVKYTDKRSRDYQDIKKYVSTTFVDLGFLTEKQVVEMFKTSRKPVTK